MNAKKNLSSTAPAIAFAGMIAALLFFLILAPLARIPGFIAQCLVKVDHPTHYSFDTYDKVLKQVVKGDFVDYKALKDNKDLDKAVNELASIMPDKLGTTGQSQEKPESWLNLGGHKDGMEDKEKTACLKEQVCFWVNVYNLLTLKAIADRYPTKTTSQLAGAITQQKYLVGGEHFSIQQLKYTVLQRILKEQSPLAIFLCCDGSMGSPALQDHAITTANLDSDIKVAIYKWINNPRNIVVDKTNRVFKMSPYLHWNEVFIRGAAPSQAVFANSYLAPGKGMDVERPGVLKTFQMRFNYNLNDVNAQGAGEKGK